ncbi:MAG: fumarylacetoacetate hydrolase family protein [Verrucomicrobiota bacterium]
MKIVRFKDTTETVFWGRLIDSSAKEAEIFDGNPLESGTLTGSTRRIESLLAPIEPKQILCIGLNYCEHAKETGSPIPEFPVVFSKSLNAVQDPGAPIELPRHLRSDQVDYECEMAIVIGKKAKNISKKQAMDYIFGYTCANDVSARDWQLQRSGKQWCRAKSFDTFCPLGPWIVTRDELGDPHCLRIQTKVNEEVLQDANTSDMIFDIPTLIEFLSGSTTLLSGTIILTGTPHGVGMGRDPKRWLSPGESVSIIIEKIGSLTNPVVEEVGQF